MCGPRTAYIETRNVALRENQPDAGATFCSISTTRSSPSLTSPPSLSSVTLKQQQQPTQPTGGTSSKLAPNAETARAARRGNPTGGGWAGGAGGGRSTSLDEDGRDARLAGTLSASNTAFCDASVFDKYSCNRDAIVPELLTARMRFMSSLVRPAPCRRGFGCMSN